MEQVALIELEEFVHETIRQIEAGAGGRYIKDTIGFEVSVAQTKRVDGNLKIYIASGEMTTSAERIQKVKFEIVPLSFKRKAPQQELARPIY